MRQRSIAFATLKHQNKASSESNAFRRWRCAGIRYSPHLHPTVTLPSSRHGLSPGSLMPNLFGLEFAKELAAMFRHSTVSLIAILIGFSFHIQGSFAQEVEAKLVSVEKIWDQAPHNAFTDLVSWRGNLICAFREGNRHVGEGGKLRIISSEDGNEWTSIGLLSHPDFDLRDAALTVMPDDRLMVLGGVQHVVDGVRKTGTFVSFSEDGLEFSTPKIVVEPGRWLWRVTRQGDESFGVAYGAPDRQSSSSLLKTSDGIKYETVVESFLSDGERPTEARIRFADDGTALCLHRRDGKTKNSAMLGIAKAPYQDWNWHDLKVRLGGPNFIRIPSGDWIAVGRLYDGGARTEVLHLDTEKKTLTPLLRLPSGGDTSYPGLVWQENLLWISYYASHEGKTSIYLAKVRFESAAPEPKNEVTTAYPVEGRRELFVDDFLVERLDNASLGMHHPHPEEVALAFDEPWEGAFSGYATVIKDTNLFRLYYRGLPLVGKDGSPSEVTCYAESKDGINWEKPDLDIYTYQGHASNNIVLMGETPASHNFSPFLDRNPHCSENQRFKALGGTSKGLLAFSSSDGIHWKRLQDEPVFSEGAFDSQNVSFWSELEECYVCYFRTFKAVGGSRIRSVSRTTSDDFLTWSKPVEMTFGESPWEHLYTNQTSPYFRAPHLYVGVAARFMPGRQVLTAAQARKINVNRRYFGDVSDAVLLTSRGGSRYQRTFMEAFVRPGLGLENWVSRSNYPALGVVPTGPDEMSVYIQKDYGQPTAHLQRYSLRTDGFSSLTAGYQGGTCLTRPMRFSKPSELELANRQAEYLTRSDEELTLATSTAQFQESTWLEVREPINIELPDSKQLGEEVTLAARLAKIPAGHRRLFSAYDGGRPQSGELILDFDAATDVDPDGSIRFFYGGLKLAVPIKDLSQWNAESKDHEPHHIAVTWDRGEAKLYFDGQLRSVARTDETKTIDLSLGNLHLGEDYSPTALENEPLLGLVDDVVIVKKCLSAAEVKDLAAGEMRSLENLKDPANGVCWLDFEQGSEGHFPNRFGLGTIDFPGKPALANRELHVNFSTSAAGGIKIAILDEHDQPLPGFSIEEADLLVGDSLDHVVTWQGRSELVHLAERPFKLFIQLKDANLFSFQIR